jgi:hypothetical protein
MKTVLATALSLACLSAAAEPDSRWFNAGETTDTKTYIQRGSLEQTMTEDGKPAATVIGMAVTASKTAVVENGMCPAMPAAARRASCAPPRWKAS